MGMFQNRTSTKLYDLYTGTPIGTPMKRDIPILLVTSENNINQHRAESKKKHPLHSCGALPAVPPLSMCVCVYQYAMLLAPGDCRRPLEQKKQQLHSGGGFIFFGGSGPGKIMLKSADVFGSRFRAVFDPFLYICLLLREAKIS